MLNPLYQCAFFFFFYQLGRSSLLVNSSEVSILYFIYKIPVQGNEKFQSLY